MACARSGFGGGGGTVRLHHSRLLCRILQLCGPGGLGKYRAFWGVLQCVRRWLVAGAEAAAVAAAAAAAAVATTAKVA